MPGRPWAGKPAKLTSWEAAEAALMADLAVGLQVLGWAVPFGAAVQAMATVPFAALALRHRLRAVVFGGIAAASVALVVGGSALSIQSLACAGLGFAVGEGLKRGWGPLRAAAFAAVSVGGFTSAVGLGFLALFASLRRLLLAQVVQSWHGVRRLIVTAGAGVDLRPADRAVAGLVAHWWLVFPVLAVAGSGIGALIAWGLSGASISRIEEATGRHWAGIGAERDLGPPGPLPVEASALGFRYPGRDAWALREVDLALSGAGFTVVVGPNGSGKSTLVRLLAGTAPTEGSLRRPAAVGLGAAGGTAVVFQRPESQVLGARVDEEVSWGLGPDREVDVESLLETVGLPGMAQRETATLSGGQLQRLAVASALARRPALLLSDESSAMLDPDGRRQLVEVLERLASRHGVRVVHVTHRWEEAAGASDVIVMEAGRIVEHGAPGAIAALGAKADKAGGADTEAGRGQARLVLRGVGLVHDEATPWASRALADISLSAAGGEGIVICGPNGSGKTSLAWILAGLVAPSEGEATLDGRPLTELVGSIGLSFQQARLQLSRATVREELVASGAPLALAADELSALGLDPPRYLERRVDTLSGGEQRRVVLAAIAAKRPPLVVLDEPLAGLDAEAAEAVGALLRRLREEHHCITVTVSHEQGWDPALGERRIELAAGRISGEQRGVALAGERSGGLAAALGDGVGGHGSAGRAEAGVTAPPSTGQAPRPDGQERFPPRRARRRLHMMRVLPHQSPLHRLWAGAKLVALVMVGLAASLNTSWPAVAIVCALALGGTMVARVPLSVLPPVPRWLLVGVGATGVLQLVAGGAPHVALFGVSVGLGAVALWVRLVVLSLALLALSFLVGLTTPLSEVAPAISTLVTPLRWVGAPVGELVTTVSLSLRSLALLVSDLRMVLAARRLHRRQGPRRGILMDGSELLVAALVAAARRAREMGDALEARGGISSRPPVASRPGTADVAFLVALALACAGIALA